MDLSSTDEGIRLKADTSAYIYSDKGGIVLESAGDKNTAGTPDQSEDDADALEYIGGIVLKSTLGIYNYTAGNILNFVLSNFYIDAKNGVYAVTDNMLLFGKKSFAMLAKKSINMISKTSTTLMSIGRAAFGGIGATSLGMKDQKIGIKAVPKFGWKKDPPEGVVDFQAYIDDWQIDKTMDETYKNLIQYTVFKETKGSEWHKFTDLKFRFLKSLNYNLTDSDGIVGSLAQQDDLVSNAFELESWQETEINGTMPFPGKEKGEQYYFSPGKLTNLEKSPDDKDLVNKADAKEKMEDKMKRVSIFTEYKVQKSS